MMLWQQLLLIGCLFTIVFFSSTRTINSVIYPILRCLEHVFLGDAVIMAETRVTAESSSSSLPAESKPDKKPDEPSKPPVAKFRKRTSAGNCLTSPSFDSDQSDGILPDVVVASSPAAMSETHPALDASPTTGSAVTRKPNADRGLPELKQRSVDKGKGRKTYEKNGNNFRDQLQAIACVLNDTIDVHLCPTTAAITKCLGIIVETARASNFTIYPKVAPDCLFSFTGNDLSK